jgi:hypothetical protein
LTYIEASYILSLTDVNQLKDPVEVDGRPFSGSPPLLKSGFFVGKMSEEFEIL